MPFWNPENLLGKPGVVAESQPITSDGVGAVTDANGTKWAGQYFYQVAIVPEVINIKVDNLYRCSMFNYVGVASTNTNAKARVDVFGEVSVGGQTRQGFDKRGTQYNNTNGFLSNCYDKGLGLESLFGARGYWDDGIWVESNIGYIAAN